MSLIPATSGNIPTYRFFITHSATEYEVFPLNFKASSFVDELEAGQVFYRRKFQGSLLFGTNSKAVDEAGVTKNRMDDWTLFRHFETSHQCDILDIKIEKTLAGVVDTWNGFFTSNDGIYDLDKCTFEVTPFVKDAYYYILRDTNVQSNILELAPVTVHCIRGTIDVDYTRNRFLTLPTEDNVLTFLADKLWPGHGVTVSSTFFNNATNPVSSHTNYLQYLTIAQKSDIIRPLSTDPATVAMMSWNELMDLLWRMFQVKWNFVANVINVEHISWFAGAAGIDLRSQAMTQSTNKYSYLKSKMPKYEKFAFMEADNTNFIGVPIWYDSMCVDQNPNTNYVETAVDVTTDIEYIIGTSDVISDSGYVILSNYLYSGDYYVQVQKGKYVGDLKLNMHLSWANLHRYYFFHNRVLITGYLNETLVTFITAQKVIQQECSAILCDDYSPEDEITTELGEIYLGGAKAVVQSGTILPSGEVKFKLLYGPLDGVNSGVGDTKVVVITQSADCLTLTAYLTQVMDVVGGLDITFFQRVWDNGTPRIEQCSAMETWNIANGSIGDTYVITPCTPLLGGCIDLFTFVSGEATWTLNVTLHDNCDNCP